MYCAIAIAGRRVERVGRRGNRGWGGRTTRKGRRVKRDTHPNSHRVTVTREKRTFGQGKVRTEAFTQLVELYPDARPPQALDTLQDAIVVPRSRYDLGKVGKRRSPLQLLVILPGVRGGVGGRVVATLHFLHAGIKNWVRYASWIRPSVRSL